MNRTFSIALLLAALLGITAVEAAQAQSGRQSARWNSCPVGAARCVTVSFREAEIHDVVASFAEFSGYSIVVGAGVSGTVTAEIRNQPWDVALLTILQAHGLEGRETHRGVIRVDARERLRENEVQEPLHTRVFRINYTPVQELAASLAPLTSDRGSITTSPATNTLIVTDTRANVNRIAALLGHPPL